jgi:hypothetical protein
MMNRSDQWLDSESLVKIDHQKFESESMAVGIRSENRGHMALPP